ncbi:MAG: hypothetical protein A2Y56_06555 [Candidatus Aminicenantes bacterium RBG_13_63_10]|nr:MAG: hypothetical protein A2Y56_06555 [Candidatus Aminicenantes bacterium RBG_13_63_10]
MLRHPRLAAMPTASSGESSCPPNDPFRFDAWEICQFWQNPQRKLQPTVAREKDSVPGRKWNRGFFSMGSTCAAMTSP